MTKCLPDPVDHASILLQHIGGLGARGDEQRVEQCAPLSLETVVRHDRSRLRRTNDLAPPRSNDKCRSRSQYHRSPQPFNDVRLETIRDEDRDPPRLDQRFLRDEIPCCPG